MAGGRFQGLEFELDVTLGIAEVRAGWSWLDTEVIDSGFEQGLSATFVEGEPSSGV